MTRWEKGDAIIKLHTDHINKKRNDKFALEYLDLLYISHFKGGNTIFYEENLDSYNFKLKIFSDEFKKIDAEIKNRPLKDISDLTPLLELIKNLYEICVDKEKGISGFRFSYLSALLHIYFPETLPIIDRIIMEKFGIVSIKNKLELYTYENYEKLLLLMKKESDEKKLSIREIDRLAFIKEEK